MRKLDLNSVNSAKKELERLERENGLKVETIDRGTYRTQGAKILFTDNSVSIVYEPQGFISTDFMGTFNSPNSKSGVWTDIANDVIQGNTEVLKASGFTDDQIKYFNGFLSNNFDPMALRADVIKDPNIKKAVGNYVSVAAEMGGLQSCEIYSDGVEFLKFGKLLGYEAGIFSTIKPKEGKKSLQQLMFERADLSDGAKVLFGISTPYDLIQEKETDGSRMKADYPGRAVLTEASSLNGNMFMYLDDEQKIIDDVVNEFSQQRGIILPNLVSVQRDGIKTYAVPNEHKNIGNIVIANTLTDKNVLDVLYK